MLICFECIGITPSVYYWRMWAKNAKENRITMKKTDIAAEAQPV
jgi:hypothetical protein